MKVLLPVLMAVLTLGVIGRSLPAGAAEEEESSDENLIFMEVPVVVTASRTEQPVTEAPSSISIVTSDEIRKFGYRTLADILASVRGFYITYDRNYTYVGVRGFAPPGDYNTRILLLVDGHRINEDIYEQAYIGTDFPLDVDLIDRVEIVRGPGSALYGSNAFFAVVNVITKKPGDYGGGEASGEAGSLDTYKARLSYGNVFKSGIGAFLSATYFHSRGNERLYYREFDSPATNGGFAEDLDHDRFASAFGELMYHDFTLQAAYSDRKKGVPTASYETIFDDSRFAVRDKHLFVDLKYERALSDDFSLMSRVNYNYHRYDGDYPYYYAAPGGALLNVINKDYSVGKWWGAEVQITKKLFERHKLVAGGEYRDNFRQEQGNYDVEVYLDDRRTSRVWAVYAEDEFTVLNNLIVNAGLRYDYYSTFGSTTNPRLALIYNPFEMTTFKLVYGTAFRAPNAYELYYRATDYKINPELGPETIETYELVYEQYAGKNLHATVAAFYNRINDLITLTTDPSDKMFVFRNAGDARAKGLEFELEGRWESGLTGRLSYTIQKSWDEQTGQTLTNSPKHLLKFNLVLPLSGEKVFLGFEEQFASRRKTLKGDYTKASWVTNVTLFSRRLVKGIEASASVYNLFDYKYGNPGSEEHAQDVIMQDGRSFRVKLTYNF